MQASLFFKMLQKGRLITHRNKYREYYEHLRISVFPHAGRQDKQEIAQYFWEQSMTPLEREEHALLKEELGNRVIQFTPPEHAMSFFRDTARGMNGIR